MMMTGPENTSLGFASERAFVRKRHRWAVSQGTPWQGAGRWPMHVEGGGRLRYYGSGNMSQRRQVGRAWLCVGQLMLCRNPVLLYTTVTAVEGALAYIP